MSACVFCGTINATVQACPECGQHYCATCGPLHSTIENGERFVLARQAMQRRAPSFYNVWRLDDQDKDMRPIQRARERYRERLSSVLKDTEGTPTPAAATPKVYRGGGGSPDEPPEGAGAPNRPRIEAKGRDQNPP